MTCRQSIVSLACLRIFDDVKAGKATPDYRPSTLEAPCGRDRRKSFTRAAGKALRQPGRGSHQGDQCLRPIVHAALDRVAAGREPLLEAQQARAYRQRSVTNPFTES